MSDERDVGLADFFCHLGSDTMDCFRMFSRGGNTAGCYVLGCWADFAAKEYIKSAAVLRDWGSSAQPLSAVVVNDVLCREIIRDCLLRRGASVEFYDRTAGGSYECVQRGSPGNIADFEASLFAFEEAEIQLMSTGAMVFGPATATTGVRVGFAALNTTLRQLSFAEYTDTAQLVSLDALISHTNLKELTHYVSSPADLDDAKVRDLRRLCERAGVIVHTTMLREQRQQATVPSSVDSALQRMLRVPEARLALNNNPLGAQALGKLLGTIDASDPSNRSALYLKHIIPSTIMKLDSAAIEALSLVSKKPEPRGGLPCSVFTWLNRCCSGMGSRMMRQWLLQPLRNEDDINQRLSMVELFVESPILRDMLISQVLKKCSDMDRLNRKLQRRSLALKDTQAFLDFVGIIPEALRILNTYQGQRVKLLMDEYIAPLEDINEHMGNLKTLIEATVDFSDRNMARISPDFDDDLAELHALIVNIQRDINKEYARVLRAYDWNEKQLKYEYHSSYGYVFRVSRKEDRQLRASKDLITVSTAKDGVRFTSAPLSSLSDQYRRVSESYDTRQQELKGKLVDTIASYLPVLDDAKEMIAMLDVVTAWSLVVKDSPRPMVRPIVRDSCPTSIDPVISLKNVRHPLVELRQPDYVANSVLLTGDTNGLIITGPNMGGKSTFMRSVGIAVVLAQAGCFVPADAAEIQIRDAVMCRVGATDHLAQGVSTFMVEMIESAAILSGATSQSLAIVDELGRGTSTYDGFGLAWAIAQDIAVRVKASLLFSTHFHELTALPSQCPSVSNVHFGADVNEAEGTLRFSYRLSPGPCGRSYGLYVASLARLPDEVLARAKVKAAELETFETGDSACLSAALDSTEAEAVQRLTMYAKRIRELENGADIDEARQRLKAEIQRDGEVSAMVSRYRAAAVSA